MITQPQNLSRAAEPLSGHCGTVHLSLDGSGKPTVVSVAPQAVATILARLKSSQAKSKISTSGRKMVMSNLAGRLDLTQASKGGQAKIKLTVGEGAGVHLILAEVPGMGDITVDVGAGASFTLSFVGALESKHTVSTLVRLAGDAANAHVQVATVGKGQGEAEFACTIEHVARATFARMVVRRVQQGSSFSTLRGMLKVGVAAHGTDTYLSDKALLLGERARAVSEPGLEILADDVKASHGATVGQISPEELFYLRSRGLSKSLAQQLLVRAFLSPALVGVPQDIITQLESSLLLSYSRE